MSKEMLMDAVQAELQCRRQLARAVVEDVLALCTEALVRQETVKLSRFGNFEVRQKQPRRGRNPRDGSTLTIEARHALQFRSAPALKAQLAPAEDQSRA